MLSMQCKGLHCTVVPLNPCNGIVHWKIVSQKQQQHHHGNFPCRRLQQKSGIWNGYYRIPCYGWSYLLLSLKHLHHSLLQAQPPVLSVDWVGCLLANRNATEKLKINEVELPTITLLEASKSDPPPPPSPRYPPAKKKNSPCCRIFCQQDSSSQSEIVITAVVKLGPHQIRNNGLSSVLKFKNPVL